MSELKNSSISNNLRVAFPDGDDADRIESFLKRGFSLNGEIVVASIFLFVKEHGKDIDEVLQECEKEWERNWDFQHPDIRGNPDAPYGAGLQNRASLENIYSALGVPSPYSAHS